MKKVLGLLLAVAAMLCGCRSTDEYLQRAMELRAELTANTVRFDAQILADYGDVTYEFRLACVADPDGTLTFTVTEPETIAGITGKVDASGGKMTFDGTALAFEMMADGQINPVSSPWVLMRTLRGGYLSSCCMEDGALRLSIDDSYADDALRLEIWLDSQDLPKEAEIYWEGRRLLWICVSNFTIG